MSSARWSEEARRYFRRRLLLTLCAVLSLGALTLISGLLAAGVTEAQQGDATTINLTGRQRLLSTRIALTALRYGGAVTDSQRAGLVPVLRGDIERMRTHHNTLLAQDDTLQRLDELTGRHLRQAEALLTVPAAELSPEHPIVEAITLRASGPLLEELDAVVWRYQDESEHRVAWSTQLVQLGALILALAPLCVWWFVAWPSIRRTAESIDESIQVTSMIAAQRERLQRVLESTGDLFIPLDKEGHITPEATSRLSDWLPYARVGQHYWDALAPEDAQQNCQLEMEFVQLSERFLPLEVLFDQMLDRITIDERVLSLRYRVLGEADDPQGYLLVASDITARISAERQRAEAEERHDILTRALTDRGGFDAFLRTTEQYLARVVNPKADRDSTLRDLHTLKGNLGLFGFSRLAARIHEIEDMVHLEGDLNLMEAGVSLVQVWEAQLEQIRPYLEEVRPGVWLSEAEVALMLDTLKRGGDSTQLIQFIQRWRWEPVEQRLNDLAQHTERLARNIGKRVSLTILSEPGIRLPAVTYGEVWGALVHLIRNLADHGIESPYERRQCGKPEAGNVSIGASLQGGDVVIRISDDGRGIDYEVLLQKALAAGLQPPEALQELLFVEGLSIRDEVSFLSGRGVGMAAVQEAVVLCGGTIDVESTLTVGTCFEIRLPVSHLPPYREARPAAA